MRWLKHGGQFIKFHPNGIDICGRLLTRRLERVGMTKTALFTFISSTASALLINNPAIAETVEITYEGRGTTTTLDVRGGAGYKNRCF